ncbi:YuzD family protein [Alkalihalobacterium alkalinitrilicum]|uniref:YuzD family protein n=1 Tax=Alkalihalobacterium alkalinitrilicum TaxID=427920 RepID=UPI0009957308|nr:YuzD family protein [Alkalihalobacterium alkalinitrilicum]
MSTVTISIYGAEVKCASCVNLPTSLETKEWLEAALSRKYPNAPLQFRYIDIEQEVEEADEKYVDAINNEEYFYPLIVIDDEVVAEGNPKLKAICEKIEKMLR